VVRRIAELAGAAVLAIVACAGDGDELGDSFDQPPPSVIFGDETDEIVVEVDYMVGAEPYTGAAGNRPELWTTLGANLDALFPSDRYEVIYPLTLDEMEDLGPAQQDSYTIDDILRLAEDHRDERNVPGRATFYVVYVDGVYERDGEMMDDILGVSISGTGVVAMFKPVIENTTNPPVVRRYAEHSTMIHELGHAIGLVNNGIPLTADHHDAANGAHCTNSSCVMYWALESVSSVIQYALELQRNGTVVLFDDDCLADVEAYRTR
jgi:predicted Zn-dependent protease